MSTPEEIIGWWDSWTLDKSQRARERLIEEFFPLAKRVAAQMTRSMPSYVDPGDVVGWSSIGLIRAVDRYDPTRGTPFGPVAIAACRSSIMDEQRKIDWAPRQLRKQQRDIARARDELESLLGRSPSEDEIGTELDISGKEVQQILHQVENSHHQSLDEHREGGEEDAYDATTPEVVFEERSVREEPTSAVWDVGATFIAGRPVAEQLILALMYVEGFTQARVGQVLRMPEARVGQLHASAVLDLRTTMLQTYRQ